MDKRELAAIKPCLRSGYCCKKATCVLGLAHGAPSRGCTFLVGDSPGEYSCQLINENPELGSYIAINAGCSSTMFNVDREIAKAKLT